MVKSDLKNIELPSRYGKYKNCFGFYIVFLFDSTGKRVPPSLVIRIGKTSVRENGNRAWSRVLAGTLYILKER